MLKKLGQFLKIGILVAFFVIAIGIFMKNTDISQSIKNLSPSLNSSETKSQTATSIDTNLSYSPLEFKKSYQFQMSELDKLKRAGKAHIQLQYKNMVSDKKRPATINTDPVGWHNYKINGNWLMNRGHLVGYQFCKLNDDVRNLVPETAYLNTGTIKGTIDSSNSKGMIYYEQRLAQWLRDNPELWLDYQVTPIYYNEELVPQRIQLNYVGITANGEKVPIVLGGGETKTAQGESEVMLENDSPNAVLNYKTGMIEK